MSDFTLYLDSVAFQGFEIPDSIKAGGAQALFKHKYPGGARTIDAMGPDDDDITWCGLFLGGTSQDRCKQLDVMRRQGQQVVLTWSGYQYLVVIADFKWDFKRFWDIEYSITLAVVQDETQPTQASSPDVDNQIASDGTQATTDSGSVSDSVAGLVTSPIGPVTSAVQSAILGASGALATAMAGIGSTLGSVTSVSTGTVNFQAGLGSQVTAALGISQGLQSTLDTTLTAAGNPALFASGTTPQSMISGLTNLAGLSSAMAATVDCTNVLGRMSVNIGQLGQ